MGGGALVDFDPVFRTRRPYHRVGVGAAVYHVTVPDNTHHAQLLEVRPVVTLSVWLSPASLLAQQQRRLFEFATLLGVALGQ